MGEPKIPTIKRLFALSGNRCAFPDCKNPVVVLPRTVIGRVCHICGDKPGSKRYDPAQSEAERQGFDNLILLCGYHHDVIDGDESTYTVQVLREIKRLHESSATRTPEISDSSARDALLLMTGAGAMAAIGDVAREIGSFVNSIVEAFREGPVRKRTEKKIDTEPQVPSAKFHEIINILRYAPKGEVQYIVAADRSYKVMISLAGLFERGGWRDGGVVRLPDGKPNPPFGILLFSLRDPNQISNARQAIDEVFKKLGFAFVREEGTESYRRDGHSYLRIGVVVGRKA